MKTILCTSVVVLSLCMGAGCSSSRKTERAAAVGAATGAVIGGVIGNQSGNPRTGAAIGAAVGGVAGGAYGSQQERQLSSNSADSSDYYISLMTPDEIETLRARARSSGSSQYQLTDFLTSQEKANLRRRDAAHREIGR